MANKNTLFNYFNKTPKGKNQTVKSDTPVKKDNALEIQFKVGDLVWCKLEGFPWWPSLVCNHPTEKNHIRSKNNGKNITVHVQFFDDPPTRSWIKLKYVKPYVGSDDKDFRRGGQFHSTRPDVNKAVLEADQAKDLSLDERLELVVLMEATSDEEEEDEESLLDGVDFDNDIFDTEMDSGKENEEGNLNVSENKTPAGKGKTPKKSPHKRRSTREPKKKRRKILESGDEADMSEDEFKPGSDHEESSEDDLNEEAEDNISDEPTSDSAPETPVKQSKKRKKPEPSPKSTPKANKTSTESLKSFVATPSTSTTERDNKYTPVISNKTKSKLSGFAASESTSTGTEDTGRVFKHLSAEYKWLYPENIRDAQQRKPDHPEYDKKTLHIPDSALKEMTPALRQWWDIKMKHFDTVLFFKMGKFYELFHMDAVVAVNELGLIYMKGEQAHSGFPEIAYGRYAEALIQKGFKVARIEQTETVPMMEERVKSLNRATKYDKVVRREVCSIQTKGTKRYSFIDGDTTDSANSFLLALCEKEGSEAGSGSLYGVCFVDTSIGKFHVGQFEDDRHCSRLRTLVSHFPPAQVLYERGKISDKTQNILTNTLVSAIKEALRPGTEFWDSTRTLKWLSESHYFVIEDSEEKGSMLPDTLKQMTAEGDSLGHSAADDCDLAVSALGAVTWYLKESLMDEELLSMKNFEKYEPIDKQLSSSQKEEPSTPNSRLPEFMTGRQKMVLDGVTLANLDVLVNSSTGTTEGSLLEVLDQCATPFGKRLFKEWLSAPLCNPSAINNRLDAMEDLINNQDVVAEVVEMLKKLPDLERQLNKIHTLGSAQRSKTHPDSRAVFFEDVTYSKRKIEDLLSTLTGFKTAQKIIKKFASSTDKLKSSTLRQVVMIQNGENSEGKFPEIKEELQFFENAFDAEKARKDGTIKPTRGVNLAFDEALHDMKTVKGKLDSYLDKQKQLLGCRTITFWGTGKNRYQMEIPESACKRLPDDYVVQSTKKGYKRYRTKHIEDLLAELVDSEERKEAAEKDTLRTVFYNFDKSYEKWELAVKCLSVLDVLINLSQFSRCGEGVMCRPQIVSPVNGVQPFLEIREGRHPCISRTFSGGDYIPNDTVIGIKDENEMDDDSCDQDHAKVVLVTGPNMGGKSTLMRQVGVIVVMGQLGCYVPAESCKLTPVDRVFTRLGATDRIMAGESTFFVELSETSAILQHATPHSLVLMDELGRGTATYDGTAIACAVVNELSQQIQCRTLFSTHYHSLVEEFSHDPNIRTGHMACMVENENESDPSQETITFLYKFIKGECPKSYGFNAAKLADIPDEIISVAHQKAKDFEDTVNKIKYFKKLCQTDVVEELKKTQQMISATC